ncbi:MAG: CNNM domain-containing protein [Candidatus Omnitrophica bacterium]|nr:CNNM domain-containing protein [Candidatus Omnitrophota bacterium]
MTSGVEKFLSIPSLTAILFVFACLSFLISATETAIISLSKIRLRHMISQKVRNSESVQRLIQKMDRFLAAILVFNNFVNIAISALVTALCVSLFGYKWGIIIATVSTALFIVIVCEITPKVIAIKFSERIALITAPIWEFILKAFKPLISIFSFSSNLIIRMLGLKTGKRSPLITEEELRFMIHVANEEGFVTEEERKMLLRIFEFGDTKVSDVMVPKDKMVGININAKPDELLNIFVEQGHARLPVFKDSLDNVVGIIYARDLLYILRDRGLFLINDLIHDAYFVNERARVSEILKKFQSDKVQMAVIVDDQKRTKGLVTLEDLIEEIVGEIEEKQTLRPLKGKML